MNIAPNGKSAQTLGRLFLRLNLRCEFLRYRLNLFTLAGVHDPNSSEGSIARIFATILSGNLKCKAHRIALDSSWRQLAWRTGQPENALRFRNLLKLLSASGREASIKREEVGLANLQIATGYPVGRPITALNRVPGPIERIAASATSDVRRFRRRLALAFGHNPMLDANPFA